MAVGGTVRVDCVGLDSGWDGASEGEWPWGIYRGGWYV